MSFSGCFDGFVVIHSPVFGPERKPLFERELTRIGLPQFEIVEPKQIAPTDPRLKGYPPNSERLVSLIDANLTALTLAEKKGWNSLVIFEDDIVFRGNFSKLWSEVESEVRTTEWDILLLHRTPPAGRLLLREARGKTTLVRIQHNFLSHCIIVRRKAFPGYRAALADCIARGYPLDFFYGIFSHSDKNRLFATSKNLSGQRGNLASSIQASARRDNFYSRFHASRNSLEDFLISSAHRLLRKRAK